MWQENYNSELYHHGVKGMKWGVRRARQTTSSPGVRRAKKPDNFIVSSIKKKRRAKELERRKESAAKARLEASKKKPAELTEKELRDRIARLELEKKYADLMNQTNPPKNAKGKKFVEDVLTSSAKNIASQTTTLLMGMAANKALEMLLNEKNAINPKKGQRDKK